MKNKGGTVPEQQRTTQEPRSLLSALLRWWWLPLLAAIAAFGFALSRADHTQHYATTGYVSTRSISDVPNDRTDLMEDLRVALASAAVLEPVGKPYGMSGNALVDSLRVEREGASTVVTVSLDSTITDAAKRTALLNAAVEAATRMAHGTTGEPQKPPTAFDAMIEAAQGDLDAANQAVNQKVAENQGIVPSQDVDDLTQQINRARAAGADVATITKLRTALAEANKRAEDYDRLTAARTAAAERVLRLKQSRDAAAVTQRTRTAWSFDLRSITDGPAGSSLLQTSRTAIAAGAGAFLLTAWIILLIILVRRPKAAHGRNPGWSNHETPAGS